MTQGVAVSWRKLYAIMRPCGRGRLALVMALLLAQVLSQTLAVFSLLPFLSAAADVAAFRNSRAGSVFVEAIGGGSDQRLLIWTGSLSLAVLVASNAVALAADYVRSRYAQLVGHRLRIRLLGELLDRRYEYFLGINSAVLLKNLVDDAAMVGEQLVLPALDITARGLLVLMLAGAVLLVEPLVAGFGAAAIAIYYLLVMWPIRRRAHRTSQQVQDNIRSLYYEVNQTLNAVKPILAAGRRDWFVARAERISARHAAVTPRIPMYAMIPRSGLEIMVFGGIIAWVLGTLIAGGDLVTMMPRVGMIAVVAYRVMPSIQLIFMQLTAMTSSSRALREISDLSRDQQSLSALPARQPFDDDRQRLSWQREIRFENVAFAYSGARVPALRGVSFVISKGQRVAFVGPTGSGKSTLIDILLGMLIPTSGQVLIDGEPLTPELIFAWRRTVGYVPQELFLLDGSIAENIAFGAGFDEIDRERVIEVAETAQARNFIESGQPQGFETIVGERGVRLSGGQRQRLALARALFCKPDVLILDEATSALDPATESRVVEAMNQASQNLTVVTVTHRINTVKNYDCIHFVEGGRIVASGTYAELAADHAGFRDLTH
ncbi:MAG: ABC transporter ATP-binding protein [Novosphingobium sp.]